MTDRLVSRSLESLRILRADALEFESAHAASLALVAPSTDLRDVVGFADLVALSFLRTADNVVRLQKELNALSASHVGMVLKIENAAAFRNLPRILPASLMSPPVGVMVARGDLAVEVGFERLSELQEEIL